MNDEQRHFELLSAIGGVNERVAIVETEVKELTRRVGIQNGRVADSEGAIRKILKTDTYEDGKKAGMKKIWISLIAVISFAIGSIVVPLVSAYILNK